MNAEHWRAFIDSLEGEKGLPEEINRLLEPDKDVWREGDKIACITNLLPNQVPQWDIVSKFRSGYGYMIGMKVSRLYIGSRAESRQIPDLKERVKELLRDAMDAQMILGPDADESDYELANAFRALCAEVNP